MADLSIDPYTQVYNRLWDLLTNSADFTSLVRTRSRINLQDTNPDPLRRNVQDADLPEVEIVQTGGAIDLWGSSSSTRLSETYRIRVATGEVRPHKLLNRVKWAICRALAQGDANLGLDFVTNLVCQGTIDALDNTAANRGTTGWSTVLVIKVDMHIDRNVLKGIRMNIVRSTITASISAQASIAFGLDQASDPLSQTYTLTMVDGTGAGQTNQQWHGSRTLAASASETLDLYGTLVDAFGETVNFARIKGVYIVNTSSTGTLTLGGAGSATFQGWFGATTDTITLRPGGVFLIGCTDTTGYPVTYSTADLLQIANNDSANPLTYQIILLGATA